MEEIFRLLQMNDWYEADEIVQVAKGKYAFPRNYKEMYKKIKRQIKSKKING